jgi:hypothetical protein
MAVNRFTNGAGGNTWGTAGNWSQGTIPTASDGHVTTFDASSPNCTVNASGRVANNIDFTGYTNTITMTNTIAVSGNVTLDAGMVISGSAALLINAASTITSGGKTWPNAVTWSGTNTQTLVGNFQVNGLVTVSASTTFNKTSAEKIIINGGVTTGIGSKILGTLDFEWTGGTWASGGGSGIEFSNNLTIAGNVTYNIIDKSGGTITYTSGTVSSTGFAILRPSTSITINTNGMTWVNITTSGTTPTITLTSNLSCSGLFTFGASSSITINKTASETLTISGGMAVNSVTLGTAKIILTGGTWSGTNVTGLANDLDLQGTITVSGNVYYRTGILTWVSGVVTVTSSTLNLTGSCTLATNGMSWNDITLSNTTAFTYTINSLLTASATLTIGTGAVQTFAGTAGFTVGTLSVPSITAITINFKESITYTVTTSLLCKDSRTGSIVLFTSSHASTKAILTLSNGASNNVLAAFTRIDASGGRPIRPFMGVITDCSNIENQNDLATVASAA